MTPVFQLFRGGVDLMPSLRGVFIRATLTDEVGEEADTLEVELADAMRTTPLPAEDEMLMPAAGYVETGVAPLGAFRVNRWETGWEEGGAETLVISARGATFAGEVKAGGLKHWDDTTLAAVLQDTARAAGLGLVIDPALGQVKLPYVLRWEASPIDFANRLAGEAGGVVKPAGEQLVVMKRGAGRGGTGALPPIAITRVGCNGWRIHGEPRPRFGDVLASWHDRAGGRRKTETHKTGRRGPRHELTHPRATQDEAKRAAEARATELTTETGGGWFRIPYRLHFQAGAIVLASGFGTGVDGPWVAQSITTEWVPGRPTLSTITVTADPSAGGR